LVSIVPLPLGVVAETSSQSLSFHTSHPRRLLLVGRYPPPCCSSSSRLPVFLLRPLQKVNGAQCQQLSLAVPFAGLVGAQLPPRPPEGQSPLLSASPMGGQLPIFLLFRFLYGVSTGDYSEIIGPGWHLSSPGQTSAAADFFGRAKFAGSIHGVFGFMRARSHQP
jgi:hypothetical protein